MALIRYVVVSTTLSDKTIYDGPFMWDGVTQWAVSSSRQAITETTAIAGGYTYPPPPIADQNAATLRTRALTALSANATYQAIASPTNAQVAAQVTLMTKECNGIIRLLLGQLDDISGT
jgi:hypothetical protein